MKISDFMKKVWDFKFTPTTPRPKETYRGARRNVARKLYRKMS
jgi:hypothetical protein